MKKMNEKKFLQQVYTKLENQLKQEVKLADDSIEILDGDKVIFRVDMCPPSKNRHNKASKNEMNRSISLIY